MTGNTKGKGIGKYFVLHPIELRLLFVMCNIGVLGPEIEIGQAWRGATYRDILDLVERGALQKDPGGGRSTSYSLTSAAEEESS